MPFILEEPKATDQAVEADENIVVLQAPPVDKDKEDTSGPIECIWGWEWGLWGWEWCWVSGVVHARTTKKYRYIYILFSISIVVSWYVAWRRSISWWINNKDAWRSIS